MAFNPVTAPTALTPEQIAAQKAQGGAPLQTIGTAAPAGQAPANGAPTQSQPQGSGRFTNIQKYISANKQGGNQIANQIGSGMQKQFGEQSQKATDYNTRLGQSISQANETAKAGLDYQNRLKDIGNQIGQATITPEQLADQKMAQDRLAQRDNQDLSKLEAFTSAPDFNKFQDIQAGRAIDENLLSIQQQRAAAQAQQALAGSQQAQQDLGSESGRFNLLRQSLGGDGRNNYNQGQQRLDQMLLGQSSGLGDVKANAAKASVMNSQLARSAANEQGNVSRITNQERGLIGDINTQAGANEKSYVDMLNSYVNPFNQKRADEYADLERAVQTYRPDDKGQQKAWESGFTDEQMKRLGLTDANQGVYNVFNKDVNTAHDIVTKGMDATSGAQIANQADVNRYGALSKIMGANAPKSITQVGDIGQTASYDNIVGEGALKSRLDAAQKQWTDEASKKIEGVTTKQYTLPSDSLNRLYTNAYSGANASDLINQGRSAINTKISPDQLNWSNWADYIGATNLDKNRGQVQNSQQQVIDQLKKKIADSNYNRTLGGRRNTFLDTEKYAIDPKTGLPTSGMTIKADPTPITQEDPSAYNNLKKLIKG
jgi:hypothetical protein